MIPNTDILVRLLIVHLAGDFLFQPKSWIENRNKCHLKSGKLYIHSLIHATLASVAAWSGHVVEIFLTIFISHFLIDLLKSYQVKQKTLWFILDQALHILVIIGLWIWLFLDDYNLHFVQYLKDFRVLVPLAAIIFLTSPTATFIGIATNRWRKKLEENKKKTLKDAGLWIGIIERLLIFVFILANQYQAIGFLLAAKTIFRFGDLRKSDEKNQTEYLMIGSLLSFGIAIITGVIVRSILY